MTLRAFDGFDGYADNTNLLQVQGDWQWGYQVNPTLPILPLQIVAGRGGVGQAIQLTGGSSVGLTKFMGSVGGSLNSNEATLFYGMALFFGQDALNNLNYIDLNILDWVANQIQFFVRLNFRSGVVQVYRYGSPNVLLGSSTAAAFNPRGYNFVEVGSTINNSTGSVEVRVAGQTVINLTNVDNQSTANAFQNGLTITQEGFSSSSTATFRTVNIDDFYVCDAAMGGGTIPTNTFLGDCRSARLNPTSDFAVAWTPLSGSVNYAMVDETQFDGDTTYNYTATLNDQDLFATNSLSSVIARIVAVQVTIASRQDGAGSSEISAVLNIGGTDYVGAGRVQSTGYQFQSTIWYDDPDTATSWTLSGVNNLKIGYKLTA
jgi:hypothetical protein